MRQAFAGMSVEQAFYNYHVARWLDGDPSQRRLRCSGGTAATPGGAA